MTKQMQQNLIAIGMFIVMLCFVYFKYVMTPWDKKIKQSEASLAEIESRLETMKKRALDLPRLEKEMRILRVQTEELEKVLPKEVNTQGILKTVTRISQANLVSIQGFAPSAPAAQPNYLEIPFRITASGNYHSLAVFLAQMGQQPRIFSAKDVALISSGQVKDIKSTVNITMTIVAYVYK